MPRRIRTEAAPPALTPTNRRTSLHGLNIDHIASAAGKDPRVLRLENLDTDLPPPPSALAATIEAVRAGTGNSYLPFDGALELRQAVAERLWAQSGIEFSHEEVIITCGGTEGLLDVLLAVTDPGEEVILTDPTYAGMINRVALAGARPVCVPLTPDAGEWRLDLDALRAAVGPHTRALMLMNPSMPSGAVMRPDDWHTVGQLCADSNLWLIYNAAMERILFDGRPYLHPASIPELAARTITVGSVSKEFRMIGWRVGWIVAPLSVVGLIRLVHISNAITPSGFAQAGAVAALRAPPVEFDVCRQEWERRRNLMMEQLKGYPCLRPGGGWSAILDVSALGFDSATAASLLLARGRIAATPMRGWGTDRADAFVRLVYSNEPEERLGQLRERLVEALGHG